MSKSVEIDYLDGEFSVIENHPNTVADLQELGFTEEDIVDDAVSNLLYRNKYPRVYRKVSEAVIATGFARKVVDQKKLKDGTLRDVKESENDHLRRFLKGDADSEGNIISAPPEGSREKLLELFTSLGQSEPIFVKGERQPGGGKVSQAAQDLASKIFLMGVDKIEAVVEKIETGVPGFKVGRDAEGAVTVDSLARGIQALDKKVTADAKKTALASLA